MTEKDKLICEIMQLAYLVQQYAGFCVFMRYSGHVESFEIDIRQDREHWRREMLKSEFYIEYNKYRDAGDGLAFYKGKRDVLLRILQEREIPYELCDVEHYTVEDYSF